MIQRNVFSYKLNNNFNIEPSPGCAGVSLFLSLDISSSWFDISLYARFQLPSMPGTGSSMVGDKNKNNSVELEASLAPAEAEVGAVAKADRKCPYSS